MKLPRSAFDIVAFALGPFLIVAFRPPKNGAEPFPLIGTYHIGDTDTWLMGPGARCLFAAGVTLVVMGALGCLHRDTFPRPRGFVDTTLIALGVFLFAAGLTATSGTSPFSEMVGVPGQTYTYPFPGPRLLLAAGAGSLCLGLVRAKQKAKGLGSEENVNKPGPK